MAIKRRLPHIVWRPLHWNSPLLVQSLAEINPKGWRPWLGGLGGAGAPPLAVQLSGPGNARLQFLV